MTDHQLDHLNFLEQIYDLIDVFFLLLHSGLHQWFFLACQETVQKVLGNNINYNKNIEFLNKEKFEILENNIEALGDYIKLNA